MLQKPAKRSLKVAKFKVAFVTRLWKTTTFTQFASLCTVHLFSETPDNSLYLWKEVGKIQIVQIQICVRDAFQKKKSVWRENVPTGGEGVKKNFKNSLLKIPFYFGTFSRGGRGSNHYFIIPFKIFFWINGLKCLKIVE